MLPDLFEKEGHADNHHVKRVMNLTIQKFSYVFPLRVKGILILGFLQVGCSALSEGKPSDETSSWFHHLLQALHMNCSLGDCSVTELKATALLFTGVQRDTNTDYVDLIVYKLLRIQNAVL